MQNDNFTLDQFQRIAMTLSEILANRPQNRALARASDVPGADLQWMYTVAYPTGAWYGDLGELGTTVSRDGLFTGYLALGVTCKVSGVPYSWGGAGVGWVTGQHFPISSTSGFIIGLGSVGVGNIVSLVPETLGGYSYSVFACVEGDKFTLTGVGGSNPRLWGFLDIDNRIISMATEAATASPEYITAPAGAAKVVANFVPGLPGYIWKGTDIQKRVSTLETMELLDEHPSDAFCDAVRGSKFSAELQTHIADFAKPGDLMVHVSTFTVISGTVYATYYANTTTSSEDPTKHIARLVYFDLATPASKTYVDLCTVGAVIGGMTVTEIYDTILLRITGQTIFLMWTAKMNGKYYRLYKKMTVATKAIDATASLNLITEKASVVMTVGQNIPIGSIGIGNIAPLTPENVAGYNYAIIPCSAGDKFTLTGIGGSNPRLWGFLDIDNRIISMATEAAIVVATTITAPANAAKLVINNSGPGTTYLGELGSFTGANLKGRLAASGITLRKPMEGDIGLMQRLTSYTSGGVQYWYTGCYIGEFNCIVRSTDLITWEYVSAPDFDNKSQWENAVYISGSKAYYFCRQKAESEYGFLTYYDLVAGTWAKPVYVKSTQSRADFFSFNSKLYLVYAPVDRNHLSLMVINTTNLEKSYSAQSAIVPDYFYPYVQVDGSTLYISYTASRRNIYMAQFTVDSADNAEIMAKLASIMSSIWA